MSEVRIITGNTAAAYAARLCKVQVISAYPITPSTPVTETISEWVETGELNAQYVRVESEHSVMTVCIAASAVGARVFTATSSHGLLYMHEQLHWAAGSRLPVVLALVNRSVGAPWSIFNDQQDSLAQRDTGWIQIYCRDNQEILDSIIQAYRIAEEVYCPVMVCYDGFVLSHTTMPVEIPSPEEVEAFLPPYRPQTILDPAQPRNINPVIFPWRRRDAEGVLRDGYMEMRWKLQHALDEARPVIRDVSGEFGRRFGRDRGAMLWTYLEEDAEVLLVSMGSLATEATTAADLLRGQGIRAGVAGIRVFRPFPVAEVREVLGKGRPLCVFQKAVSYGYEGALTTEIKAALYGGAPCVSIKDFIVGLGGRDVKAGLLAEAVRSFLEKDAGGQGTVWLDCAAE